MKNTEDIKSWARDVVEQVKAAFGINSGKSLMRSEVGKILSSDLAKGLRENSKEAVAAFKAVKTELDYQRKLDLIDEETYYENLEILRDKYFSQGSENWVKYTAEIYKYQKELLENETKNIEKIYDTVADYADEKFAEIRKKQNGLASQLGDFGGIFKKNTVYMNGKKDGVYYSTRDMREDIKTIETYAARLSKLREMMTEGGLSGSVISGFLGEINAMGTAEGLSFMNYLIANGEKNAVAYARLWGEKQSIAEAISEEAYRSEFEETAEAVAVTLKTALEEAGYEIPEGFFESGRISAENFGEAFLSELETQFAEIQKRISRFTGSLAVTSGGGNIYNSTENTYNISGADAGDTVEQIKRLDAVKRLSGV